MGDPTTNNRYVQDRGTSSLRAVRVWVKPTYPNTWLLFFSEWIAKHEVVQYLFKFNRLPSDTHLYATKGDTEVSQRWTLKWPGPPDKLANEFTGLTNDLYAKAVTGGTEFEEDASERARNMVRRNEEELQRIRENLPEFGMTSEEEFINLRPGPYVVAPRQKVVALPPLQPNEKYPPNVDWMSRYKNGYFLVVHDLNGTKLWEAYPISDAKQFWWDITWDIRSGMTLRVAVKKYGEDWDRYHLEFIKALISVYSQAPSLGRRADLIIDTAASDANKMIRRTPNPAMKKAPMPSNRVLSQVDPLAAAAVAVQGYSTGQQVAETIEHIIKKDELELESVGNSVSSALIAMIRSIPERQVWRELDTGQKGEKVAKFILELRGYEVMALQNTSGHGIDLVAIKVKGDKIEFIFFIEVKASKSGSLPKLSPAQQNTPEFVRDRLQRAVDQVGHWQNQNVSQETIELARFALREIEAGRPIQGMRIEITNVDDFTKIKAKVRFWKPRLPRARTVRQRPSRR